MKKEIQKSCDGHETVLPSAPETNGPTLVAGSRMEALEMKTWFMQHGHLVVNVPSYKANGKVNVNYMGYSNIGCGRI